MFSSLFRFTRYELAATAALGSTVALAAQNPVLVNGSVQALHTKTSFTLANRTLQAQWADTDGSIHDLQITDKLHHSTLQIPFAFQVLVKDGRVFTSDRELEGVVDIAPK